MNLLFTFPTTNDAMRAEKFLKSEGVDCQLKPVPRKISSSCGYALAARFDEIGSPGINLLNEGIELEGCYENINGYEAIPCE
ncbi:DUF3343 domain-containing protein [Halanaerobiaceae bacterium Z-7014]|uniref:DUF3343 domain-containing protein n=1 Tax=Halonatronomonas betaini TaxID=2778430 RepID=A0A931AU21_9FIRM|nr:DUF3343 domain-containing protein [Halonatronomonas betaini]MBF8436785.1 DUF3343 domain-containing protein [Halonatronomonas betaini]